MIQVLNDFVNNNWQEIQSSISTQKSIIEFNYKINTTFVGNYHNINQVIWFFSHSVV